MLTDTGTEEWNPLSKGQKCRGGHKWQFLYCEKSWWVSVYSCLVCLGTERWNHVLFIAGGRGGVLTCRRCQSCGNFLENFRWVSIHTITTKTWQGILVASEWHSAKSLKPTLAHLLVSLLAILYPPLCCSKGDGLLQHLYVQITGSLHLLKWENFNWKP